MRIYLPKPHYGVMVEGTKGMSGKVHDHAVSCDFPAAAFYEVPDGHGQAWIDASVAYEATADNRVRAWSGLDSVTVDFDAGDTLEGLTPNAAEPPPESNPEPLPEPETGLSDDGDPADEEL